MSDAWLVVLVVGVTTIAFRAAGPVALGGRALPGPVTRVVALLAPTLLAALVVVSTVATGRELVLDARLVGVGAAAVALRAPILVVVAVAAVAAAAVRAL